MIQFFNENCLKLQTNGIHHITAIDAHPQENAGSYATVLGLRGIRNW